MFSFEQSKSKLSNTDVKDLSKKTNTEIYGISLNDSNLDVKDLYKKTITVLYGVSKGMN